MSFSSTYSSDFPENQLPISLNFLFPSFPLRLNHLDRFLRLNKDVLKRFPADLLVTTYVVWSVEHPSTTCIKACTSTKFWFSVGVFLSICPFGISTKASTSAEFWFSVVAFYPFVLQEFVLKLVHLQNFDFL